VREGSGAGAAAEEEWEEAAGEGHGLELGAAAAEEQLPFRRRGDLGIAGETEVWFAAGGARRIGTARRGAGAAVEMELD